MLIGVVHVLRLPASGPMYIVFRLLPLMVVWVLFVWFRFCGFLGFVVFGSLRLKKKRDEDTYEWCSMRLTMHMNAFTRNP